MLSVERGSYRRFIQRVDDTFERGFHRPLFEQLRNFLNCAILFAAGSYAINSPQSLIPGFVPASVIGFVIIAIAAMLWLTTLYDALRHLRMHRFSGWFTATVALLYTIASLRVIEVVWQFRVRG